VLINVKDIVKSILFIFFNKNLNKIKLTLQLLLIIQCIN